MPIRPLPAAIALLVAATVHAAEPHATLLVNWTHPTRSVNRALFSMEGVAKVWHVSREHPKLMDSYLRLNPHGTHARMETWIHLLEPENDNDDPHTFNWDALRPQEMIRFIEDRQAFETFLDEIGVERLSLLCYNVDWNRSGDEDDPVASKPEWAEFAAAVVHDYNGDDPADPPKLRHVELWNEPNLPMFYGGTRDSYFELFRIAAERLHREYPGVSVGGPALTPAPWADPEGWYRDFIDEVGVHADHVIHHIYHGATDRTPRDLADELVQKSDMFRALPGKARGRIALTETDAWMGGWPKVQYLLGRHFRFLEIQDRILAIHQFTVVAYNESGDHIFGMIDHHGAPLLGTYWPYWLFRNVIGDEVEVLRRGDAAAELDVVATRHDHAGGARLHTAVVHNPTDRPISLATRLYFEPAGKPRVLTIDRVTREHQGVAAAHRIDAGRESRRVELELGPGEAVALTLREDGRRHFGFADLNHQERPWLELASDAERFEVGDELRVTARVLNTTLEPVSGRVAVAGLPDGWTFEPVSPGSDRIDALAFGQERAVEFTVVAASEPPRDERMTFTDHSKLQDQAFGVSPFAILLGEGESADRVAKAPGRGSLPVAIIWNQPSEDADPASESEAPPAPPAFE